MLRKVFLSLLTALLIGNNVHASPKANLSQFDTLTHFPAWTINAWQALNSKALIIERSPSKAYLLILNRPLPQLRFNETIQVSQTGSQVHAGFDHVRVVDRLFYSIPAYIDTIYRLDSRDDIKLARQLVNG